MLETNTHIHNKKERKNEWMKGRKRKASALETSEEWYQSCRHSSLWKSTFLPECWVPIWTIIRGRFHLSSPKSCSIYLTSVYIYNGLFSGEKSWQFEVGSVPVFRWTDDVVCLFGDRLVHETVTYRCDDTRGCVMQFWPPDDEHMCSKHVEAWNKLTVLSCTRRPPIGVTIPEAV